MGQETEQNKRRSEGADHSGTSRKYVQVLWKDGVQRENKKWKNTEKAEK